MKRIPPSIRQKIATDQCRAWNEDVRRPRCTDEHDLAEEMAMMNVHLREEEEELETKVIRRNTDPKHGKKRASPQYIHDLHVVFWPLSS